MNPQTIRIVLGLFTASGMCALIYQLVWTRWLGLILGNFATATATVVAIFMAGLALGNMLSGKYSSRLGPRRALGLYAYLEGGLALLAALSPLFFATSSALYPALAAISSLPALRALVCAALILPPTILMGATLPALVRALSASAPRALGPLYALNTLGGALGPLLAAFLLMPALGLTLTVWTAAALNLAVALVARKLTAAGADGAGSERDGPLAQDDGAGWPVSVPFALAAASGFVALSFEIGLTRLFVLTITGGSVYGFAIILSSFLLGLALGAALLRKFPPRNAAGALLAFAAAEGVAWLFSITTPFWDMLPPLLVRVWWTPIPFGVVTIFNFVVVVALLLVLTTSSGYALPALAAALRRPGPASIGRLFAANTVGGVFGSLTAGFILLPFQGLNTALLITGAVALAVAVAAAALASPRWRIPALVAAPFLLALPFFLPKPDESILNAGMYNRPHGFRPGAPGSSGANPVDAAHKLGRIIYEKDSLTARITVRAVSPMEMSFIVNGKPDGSTNRVDMYTQIFMGHLAALTHPDPKRALVIGLGTGTTTGCLTLHRSITEIHVAEIEPAQIEVAEIFHDHNYNAIRNPRVTIHLDDARHYLLTDSSKYDLIVSEPSNLFVSGMTNLFTAEFYRMVRSHLNPGGVFLQWVHYYRVRPEDLRGMMATYLAVFPHVMFWVHEYGDGFLLAKQEDFAVDYDGWKRRLDAPELTGDLRRVGISPPIGLLGFALWGPADVERYARGAKVCTDDNPYFEFTTPRIRYIPSDVSDLRIRMQLYGPLDPLPLVRESSRIRAGLGEMFLERGSLARAFAEYRRAIALDPSSIGLALKIAYIQWDLLSLKEEAEETLLILLKRQPSNAEALKKLREVRAGRPPLTAVPGPESPAESYSQ